ncbi:MAG TPA: polyphosphate polymerase domain-containing protein [Gemmataceae bacterium]
MENHLFAAACPEEAASPSLVSVAGGGDAYEVKFRLTAREAEVAETWARKRLTPDPHGDDGVYRTTSLYLDTPFLDIYHKTPGYRRSKYRLRRYGSQQWVHLERKTRRGDRVRKRRDAVSLEDVPRLLDAGGGAWFAPQVRQRLLQPVCWIGYMRTAFLSAASGGPMRLTLDRDVVGTTALGWTVPDRVDGRPLLLGEVILELKFRASLPTLFHELLAVLPSRLAGVSKYGRCVEAWGLAGR